MGGAQDGELVAAGWPNLIGMARNHSESEQVITSTNKPAQTHSITLFKHSSHIDTFQLILVHLDGSGARRS